MSDPGRSTRAAWIVMWGHSRNLYRPRRAFVPMPGWLNDIRDRVKRGIDPSEAETRLCLGYLRSIRPDVPDPM